MEQNKKFEISADALKWIAIITMFIDHVGAAILEKQFVWMDRRIFYINIVLRLVGRVAFPIFCFQLIEGFTHTRSKKKYFFRLFLFALLSEYPFDLAFKNGINFSYQNVFMTLSIGFLTIWAVEKIEHKNWSYKKILMGIAGLAGALAAELLHTDYGAIGVILIFILYLCRDNRKKQCILGAVCIGYEITSVFSFLLAYHYNGVRKMKRGKYFFYCFYPLHLLFLYGIRRMLGS